MMFLPTRLDHNYEYSFNYKFEELFFKTDPGSVINALHFKVKQPKGVILYFHGNAGDLSRWGKITEYFVAKNYDVLVMDYRTFGKSKGKLSEAAIYNDAQYCYDYLSKRYKAAEITIFGRSLGTGVASYVASKNEAKQLVLETPYHSILDVAKHRFPIFPVKHLLKYKFPTYKYLPQVSCPITIFHGTEDAVVPYESAKKLNDLNLENLRFITISEGEHNNLVSFKIYEEAMEDLLN